MTILDEMDGRSRTRMKKTNKRPVAFVLTATNHGTMLVNRHDYRLTQNGGYGLGYQIFKNSCFDQNEVDTVLRLLTSRKQNFGDGVVAIDCGANVGVHTIEWASFMHNWGKVIAFEAQERVFYALAGNITMNNCFNARAIWAAIGSQKGNIKIPIPNYLEPASFGSLEIRPNDKTEFIGQKIDYSNDAMQTIDMMAIDDLDLKRLDFIKIDIEGMEIEALQGAKTSIEKFKPQILVERIKSDETAIKDFLKPFGYQIFEFGINFLAIHQDDPAVKEIKAPSQ